MNTHIYFRRNLAALMMLIASTTSVLAQPKLQQAKDLKANFNFKEAIEMYNEAFKTSTPGIDDARDMAKCYMMINDSRSSEIWLEKVNKFKEASGQDLFQYASILKTNGKYKDAIEQFSKLNKSTSAFKDKAEAEIFACKKAIEWMSDSAYISVANESKFNSANCDFGLIPFSNGYLLTSDRKIEGKQYSEAELYGWTGNPYLKLFAVFNDKGQVTPVNAINNEFHNGPGNFDVNNNTLFFTRTKMMKVPKKPVNNDPTSFLDKFGNMEYVNRLEIYSVKVIDGSWKLVMPFKFNRPAEHSVGHPALSPDGKTLYFVSDMKGGYGGTDIYYCEMMADGQWSEPKNAGSKVNTDGKEVFPYVDRNGILYFSSDGHPGMGGLDLYSAKGNKDQWSEPENLKHPINSPKDDFSIYYKAEDNSGYFSSNREGGKGEDDIYSFRQSPPTMLILAIRTKEKISPTNIVPVGNINIKVINTKTNQEKIYTTDKDGKLHLPSACGAEYQIVSVQNEFYTQETKVATKCVTKKDTAFAELVLERIILNKPIVIENIYYDFNKSDIRPDAAIELDKVVAMLKMNPQISIELSSHTDSRGKDEYNEKLSQRRATSAVQYIISKGIAADRITAKGYGEKMLLNKCEDGAKCSEAEHQINRRTEFKVTSINFLSLR